MLTQKDILRYLSEHKAEFQKKYQVERIGLFGSYATGNADHESDIDIVIDLRKTTLSALVGIKNEIESYFHTHVDVIQYRERMNSFLKARIERDTIYV